MKIITNILLTIFVCSAHITFAQWEYFDGPTSVYVGTTVNYYYSGPNPNGTWNVGGTGVRVQWSDWQQIFIEVISPGSFTLTYNSSIDGFSYVEVPIYSAPPTPTSPYVFRSRCNEVILAQNYEAIPPGTQWWWQTTPNGRSFDLGNNASITITSSNNTSPYYLQSYRPDADVWGGTSPGVNVSVPQPPVDASITANRTQVCTGEQVRISISGGIGEPHYWCSTNGGSSWNIFSDAHVGEDYFFFTPQTAGTYRFHVRNRTSTCGFCWDSGGSCTAYSYVDVVVGTRLNNGGVLTVNNTNYANTCVGKSVEFRVDGAVGTPVYWVSDNNGDTWEVETEQSFGNPFTYSFPSAGAWKIKMHAQNECGLSYNESTVAIGVGPSPTLPSVMNAPAVCPQRPVTLHAHIPETSANGTRWYENQDDVNPLNAYPYRDYVTPPLSANKQYWVSTYQFASTCESERVAVTASVAANPPVDSNISASYTTICEGQDAVITTTGGNGTPHYWCSSDGGNTWNVFADSYVGQTSFRHKLSSPGTYRFHVRNATNCGFCWDPGNSCTDYKYVDVVVVAKPNNSGTILTNSLNNNNTCVGNGIEIRVEGGSGTPVYWISDNNGDTWDIEPEQALGNPFTYYFSAPGVYTIKTHSIDQYCGLSSNESRATISVWPSPTLPSVMNPPAVCPGNPMTLNAYIPETSSNGTRWYENQNDVNPLNAYPYRDYVTPPLSANKQYWVSTYQFASTCESERILVTARVAPNSPVDSNISASQTTICEESDAVITISGGHGTPHYWCSSDGGNTWNVFADSFVGRTTFHHRPPGPGTYRYMVRNATNCGFCWDAGNSCADYKYVDVTVVRRPNNSGTILTNSPNNNNTCVGNGIEIRVEGGSGTPVYWISDNNGDTWEVETEQALGNPFTYYFPASGVYTIKTHSIDQYCGLSYNESRATISVWPSPVLPSVISPPAVCPEQPVTLHAYIAEISANGTRWYENQNDVNPLNVYPYRDYITPPLSANKQYWVSTYQFASTCESERIPVTASIMIEQPPLLTGYSVFGNAEAKITVDNPCPTCSYRFFSTDGTEVNPNTTEYFAYLQLSESKQFYATKVSAMGCESSPSSTITLTSYTHPVIAANGNIIVDNIPVTLSTPETYTSYKWIDAAHNTVGTNPTVGINSTGEYALEVTRNGILNVGRSQFVRLTKINDDYLNWIETILTDDNNKVYSNSRSYFDLVGEHLQTQSKLFLDNNGVKVFTAQNLKDCFYRTIGSTLSAPTSFSDFNYRHYFILDENSENYEYNDFDGQATKLNPLPVDKNTPGTVGWYYSSNNNLEENVPVTDYPYSRIEFYEDGTGEVKRATQAGDEHRLGKGHEVLSGTFPVYAELSDYMAKRGIALPGVSHDGSLFNEAVQSVTRDENGIYAIAVADKSGKALASFRAGTSSSSILTVSNTIHSSGKPSSSDFRAMTYFYILQDQAVSISGSTDFIVEDIVANVQLTPGVTFANTTNGMWPAGFYRILLNDSLSAITLSYVNYFQDVSYQFYDDASRLRISLPPNGFKAWQEGTTYGLIDKAIYEYNHRGWLLKKAEPDAGVTRYVYRKDGKIRFSQNAEQKKNSRFSYTHYDKLGRPIESGEYTGTLDFIPMDSAIFIGSLMQSELEKTFDQVTWEPGERKDWIKTHYDIAVPLDVNIPSSFVQEFIRGAVSCAENENSKTWYSYDELGRVKWRAQKPAALGRAFVTTYTYDFLGNVLTVKNLCYVQQAVFSPFTFNHFYQYDANKRLSKVFTSTDDSSQKLRASYEYYLHGPLKRIELGDNIQGIDFVYNIQGWLTQINHPDKLQDPGDDENDAFGMLINYYESSLQGTFPTTNFNSPQRFHKVPALNYQEESSLGLQPPIPFFKAELLKGLEKLKENASRKKQEAEVINKEVKKVGLLIHKNYERTITSEKMMILKCRAEQDCMFGLNNKS